MSGDPEEDFFENNAGDGMDARMTQMETRTGYSRAELALEKFAAERALARSQLIEKIKELPTKDDLMNYRLQAIGIWITIYLLVVTAIAGWWIFLKKG
jgi:hypothetical protein